MINITLADKFGEMPLEKIVSKETPNKYFVAVISLLFASEIVDGCDSTPIYVWAKDKLLGKLVDVCCALKGKGDYIGTDIQPRVNMCIADLADTGRYTFCVTDGNVHGACNIADVESLLAQLLITLVSKERDRTEQLCSALLLYAVRKVFAYDPMLMTSCLAGSGVDYEALATLKQERVARLLDTYTVRYNEVAMLYPYGTSIWGSVQELIGELRLFMGVK